MADTDSESTESVSGTTRDTEPAEMMVAAQSSEARNSVSRIQVIQIVYHFGMSNATNSIGSVWGVIIQMKFLIAYP